MAREACTAQLRSLALATPERGREAYPPLLPPLIGTSWGTASRLAGGRVRETETRCAPSIAVSTRAWSRSTNLSIYLLTTRPGVQ